ncbi:MAG: MBL fold metallo-hydrolase, partial [Acidimicrobiales bacterium]
LLERAISPPHFPVTPSELGNWTFSTIEEGTHELEGFSVAALEIPHKGGRTFGYRVSDGDSSIAYLSDHCPMALGPGPKGIGHLHDKALQLASGVDLLIHDAQYLAGELPGRWHYGHSSPEYALDLGLAAGSREVVFFHHAQERTDSELDDLAERFAGSPAPVRLAYDGLSLDVGRSPLDPGPSKAPAHPPQLGEWDSSGS